jgi:hypothetical protein
VAVDEKILRVQELGNVIISFGINENCSNNSFFCIPAVGNTLGSGSVRSGFKFYGFSHGWVYMLSISI